MRTTGDAVAEIRVSVIGTQYDPSALPPEEGFREYLTKALGINPWEELAAEVAVKVFQMTDAGRGCISDHTLTAQKAVAAAIRGRWIAEDYKRANFSPDQDLASQIPGPGNFDAWWALMECFGWSCGPTKVHQRAIELAKAELRCTPPEDEDCAVTSVTAEVGE